MNEIEFVHLHEVEKDKIIDLMNNREVGLQMPLLSDEFSRKQCDDLIQAKKDMWTQHGYGPWAFLIHGEFAGWGGLQPEQGEVDFALVLHPNYWGWGRKIFLKVRDIAFGKMKFQSITVLFPPSRTNYRAILRFGFVEDSQIIIDDALFRRFRLNNPIANSD